MRQLAPKLHELKAFQQPEWEDAAQVRRVREVLSSLPPLVTADAVGELRSLLGEVAAGRAHVLQAGDCAEDPAESSPADVRRKSALLDALADILGEATGKPVLRVGRIAGQYAKPRSERFEQVGEFALPVFRGHMVNAPEPDPQQRRPDPERMLTCYRAADDIARELDRRNTVRPRAGKVWTSHEALLLDYEVPMVRESGDGSRWLGSAHWPWIGERTRQTDGAHVRLLADVVNPVSCKIGPGTTPAEVTALCEQLDPGRDPGRLTLISRMGAHVLADRLPPLVRAVRAAGHPVVWLCDPMHGNTITAPDGNKTRLLQSMLVEVRSFLGVMAVTGGVAGGLHLETTPDEVTECVADISALGSVGDRHTTFCDPRLNPGQAVSLVSAWSDSL
ncbi:3-deoxy-7-phosphoheptulonate synthase [Streptomyces sp. APSN-46.1]|uniref:3-deoxy-7-phosphoheptulonate synthase n=1 Tax=Streptomyces sp. APSN-46.1 TaxID=2929049 RepID=UPI001FB1C0A7|nr:3-deoxy-7-phosphoheptulonate synthase [Streptomyces sp. APSN-46.1]MCJ1680420.1 3-deoxy-7-phosphoheptulonate synthase [Streptomyces sp. APSN-46.1]